MSRVKALNRNGEVTWCTAKTPGSGNCNHVLHQIDGMTDSEFQKQVDEYSETMTKKMYSNNGHDRVECAEAGYGSEFLVNDKSPAVRAAVARHGDQLDKLSDDPDEFVRAIVAAQGKHLDKLINDPSPLVRKEVAKQNYGLEILKDDPSLLVRDCTLKQIKKKNADNEKLLKKKEKKIEKHIQESTLSDIERRNLKHNGGLDVFEELYNDNGVGLTNENIDVILQDSSHTKLASSLRDYLEEHKQDKLVMVGLEKRHQHYFGKDVRQSKVKYFNNIGFYVIKNGG